jgi:hypothetical protein
MTTSSFCSKGGCVEVAYSEADDELNLPALVVVSTTRNPVRRVLFTPTEWREFLLGVKAGEFDIDRLDRPYATDAAPGTSDASQTI